MEGVAFEIPKTEGVGVDQNHQVGKVSLGLDDKMMAPTQHRTHTAGIYA